MFGTLATAVIFTFARGLPANNALLWGARGMGKSSLVKAVHAEVSRQVKGSDGGNLKLVEIHREDIGTLPRCLMHLRETKGQRFILFCDDLSFEEGEASYKALKAALGQFPDAMLVEAGLRIAVDNKEPYDRFRGRLMLPIHDARGRVIAFGGRILDKAKTDAPKYLNSPETPIYSKSSILYHLVKKTADFSGADLKAVVDVAIEHKLRDAITIRGTEDMAVQFATCCRPRSG